MRSYKKLCQDLYNEKDMNCGTDFYMGAASILLDMPIMLIKPKQVKLQGGKIGYNFWQEYLLEEDKNLQVKDFKICLVFYGINHYAPFYPKELGNLINTGYKRMKQVRENYQDIKEVSQKIPKNVKINGAIQQMLIHLRAVAQIAESIRFECGVGDTSSVSQLPMPLDTGASLPSVRKRKQAEETEDTEQPPPKHLADGSDRCDTVMMPKQCHCGKVFESDNNLKRHIGILHKNDYWQCSGDMFFDDGSTEHCRHIAVDRFALWRHYRSIHQGRYFYYCDVQGCNYGVDEETEIPKHKLEKHNKQPKKDDPAIICQNCKKVLDKRPGINCIFKYVANQTLGLFNVNIVKKVFATGTNFVSTIGSSTRKIKAIGVGIINVCIAGRSTLLFLPGGGTIKRSIRRLCNLSIVYLWLVLVVGL